MNVLCLVRCDCCDCCRVGGQGGDCGHCDNAWSLKGGTGRIGYVYCLGGLGGVDSGVVDGGDSLCDCGRSVYFLNFCHDHGI